MRILKDLEHLFQIGILFIEKMGEARRGALVFDTDVDGIASATLILAVLEKMGKCVETIPLDFSEVESFKTRLKKFDEIITVDVPTDLIEKHLVDLGKKMLIIDHHPGRDLNSEKIVLVNPRLENPEIYQPTSYVIYKMFKDRIKEEKWVAILGTVGDMGIDDCKDLVMIKDRKSAWKSKFGKAAMFTAGSISVLGAEKTLKILAGSKSLEDVMKNREMISASRRFDQELERCEKEFEENLEVHGKILISKIKPGFKGVCSALITRLATENREKMIFIFEDRGKIIRVHGRNSIGRADVGELFRRLEIGGGHEEAGAGTISKRCEERVKRKLLSELRVFSS